MAMSGQYGNGSNNGGKENNYHVNVYSRYTWSNPNSEVDQTKLSPMFTMGMLKLNILPKVANSNTDYPKWDKENGVGIYLTHTKAKLFMDRIIEYLKDPSVANNVGVDSGTGENQGIIQFSNGKEFGTNNFCLIIRRLSVENGVGQVQSSYVYEFKKDTHYTIENFDADSMNFDRIYNDDIEVEQLLTLLDEYVKAQTNAIAFRVREELSYTMTTINSKLDAIGENAGVKFKSGNSNNKGGGVSIFGSKDNGRSYNTETSIDDIDNM